MAELNGEQKRFLRRSRRRLPAGEVAELLDRDPLEIEALWAQLEAEKAIHPPPGFAAGTPHPAELDAIANSRAIRHAVRCAECGAKIVRLPCVACAAEQARLARRAPGHE